MSQNTSGVSADCGMGVVHPKSSGEFNLVRIGPIIIAGFYAAQVELGDFFQKRLFAQKGAVNKKMSCMIFFKIS
jgi:hypothetical protein